MDVNELLAYIEQNIKEDISLVDLEQVVHYSPRQIYYIIKEATGMDDEAYIAFVKKYENKSFTEIEPIELREKIINTFASINSNVRNGHREYNEMYISNPNKVSGVFAYSKNIQNEDTQL